MPQINSYTYLSVTTWTIILFFLFYYLMKQYIIPIIYENIKIKSYLNKSTQLSPQTTEADSSNIDYYSIYNNNLIK
jgi:hypothetical protein